MSTADDASLNLGFRPATLHDWPTAVEIVAGAWQGSDYIEEERWKEWVEDPNGRLEVATHEGRMIAFCRLTELGPAEWWLERFRVAPGYQDQEVGRILMGHMIDLFEEVGHGILRTSARSDDESVLKLAPSFGFRHIVSYTAVEAPALTADYRNFRLLQPHHLDMVHRYLLYSPMYRVNKFAEHGWVFYNLTRDRLAEYLAAPEVQVTGWRQFDQLHGLALLFVTPHGHEAPDGENALYIGYLAAPDDTTLLAMLTALRGLAVRRGLAKIAWKMPLGVGLEGPVFGHGDIGRVGEYDMYLFERPFKRVE
ncbi:MAG TPA: GNAT family N-acetyltransferase [Chloroflexi bacterium]|nr:GNAT family N-acetyltransferase [Chloroflexota bacterium]